MAWRSDIPVAPIVGPSSSSQPAPKADRAPPRPPLGSLAALVRVDPELVLSSGGTGPNLHKGITSQR
jgi:hypothetical protein